MNLPNSLTLGRIFLVPLLVVVLLTKFPGRELFGVSNEILGATIFAVASLTDWLDGYLARRRGQVTGLGQWMDPLADKMLVTAALVSLVANGLASAWMVAVILGREFAVTVLRSVLHARGHSLPASGIGKIKMASQVAAILLLILAPYIDEFYLFGQIAMWVATITALISAIDYSRRANAALGAKPIVASPSVKTQAERPPVSTRIRA
ncbi:MAG TPA: CDP-diacylglycerol--glycerol-3-phosphate 3-phosphatidyltransferase [Vicinamibacterales bacterium]|nr:CDP-diacylglycerol--glycerol-3-phosphate 3-phosphatidyltransferase [Vicinamibacterales bacterium]